MRAVASRDLAGLRDLFADRVTFRALTPGRLWEVHSGQDVVDLVLAVWFPADTVVIRVVSVETTHVAGRARVDYELSLQRPDGAAVVAQTAYYSASAGRITSMDLVCSGIRPACEHG